LVVLLHGWEGSANSTYMMSAAMELLDSGFAVFRLNLRDHGQSHHLNEGLFHSCRLAEVIGAVQWISRHYQPTRLSLAGFSLGANFALRVAAGTSAQQLRIDRVVAACPVLDPVQTMAALDGGWFVYRQYFIRRWRNSLRKKMEVFPDSYRFDDLQRFTSLEAMTDHFVRHYTEYEDLHSYLNGYALTGDRLAELKVPSIMLLAGDDPIIPMHSLNDVCRSHALRVIRTPRGGHCGFIDSLSSQTWLDKFLVDQLSIETEVADHS
jgi:predicted alpha/beta-fold hydrolase